MLHVLGRLVALESRQAALLSHICEGRLMNADGLRANGAFDAHVIVRHGLEDERQRSLLKDDDT